MSSTEKNVSIVIITNSKTQAGNGVLESVMLSPAVAMPELLQDDDDFFDDRGFDDTEDDGGVFSEPPRDHGAPIGDGQMTVSVIGRLSYENGVTNLTYNESELTNMNNSVTVYSFRDPGEITMVREGNARTTLCFNEKRERRICCYNNSIFPVEIAVVTEKYKNNLSFERGGSLDVTYSLELKGIPVETTRIRVRVKEI